MELRDNIVQKFGISYAEADKMIAETAGWARIRRALVAATRGEVVKADPSPEVEAPRRKFAIGVLKQGVQGLVALQEVIDQMIRAEKKLINQKIETRNSHQGDWWDMRGSGWSAGGRENFAHCLCDILNNLDETTLGKSVRHRMGFNRAIVLPDELKQDQPQLKLPVEATWDDRLATFEAAMMRVGRDPGVQTMVEGPAWKFRFTNTAVTGSAGAIAEVRLRDSMLTVAALNSPHGREPREYRVARSTPEKIVKLVRAAVKDMF